MHVGISTDLLYNAIDLDMCFSLDDCCYFRSNTIQKNLQL